MFHRLPDSLCALLALRHLDLGLNMNLLAVPANLGDLSALTSLHLDGVSARGVWGLRARGSSFEDDDHASEATAPPSPASTWVGSSPAGFGV